MDEAQIEDMWMDFSRRIRAGEVQSAGGQVVVPLCLAIDAECKWLTVTGSVGTGLVGVVWELVRPALDRRLAAPHPIGWDVSHTVRVPPRSHRVYGV